MPDAFSYAMRRLLFPGILCLWLLSALPLLAWNSPRCAVVSIADQQIAVIDNGCTVARFPVSTSRYGVGDRFNSFATPLGTMQIAGKIGDGAPVGAVFRHRQMTGEILRPDAPGRDPIVTRILWLRGLERCNEHAFSRNIYIHGTPAEHLIGRPASFGCIRMRSRDIIALFNMMPLGATVQVSERSLSSAIAFAAQAARFAAQAPRYTAQAPRYASLSPFYNEDQFNPDDRP